MLDGLVTATKITAAIVRKDCKHSEYTSLHIAFTVIVGVLLLPSIARQPSPTSASWVAHIFAFASVFWWQTEIKKVYRKVNTSGWK